MQMLRNYLDKRGLPAALRSTLAEVPIAAQTACLVLDTMGELRDFYAAATVAHVGVDHNVLEPLTFGKPVTVVPGWDTTYPSYPVYRVLMDSEALMEAAQAGDLSNHWLRLMERPEQYRERMLATSDTLTALRGAVAKHLTQMGQFLQAVQNDRK